MSCKCKYRGTSDDASTDNPRSLSNFMIPGKTLPTGWELSPPAHRVDLAKLETLEDPDWACYHTAFHPNGFDSAFVHSSRVLREVHAQTQRRSIARPICSVVLVCVPQCAQYLEARWGYVAGNSKSGFTVLVLVASRFLCLGKFRILEHYLFSEL